MTGVSSRNTPAMYGARYGYHAKFNEILHRPNGNDGAARAPESVRWIHTLAANSQSVCLLIVPMA